MPALMIQVSTNFEDPDAIVVEFNPKHYPELCRSTGAFFSYYLEVPDSHPPEGQKYLVNRLTKTLATNEYNELELTVMARSFDRTSELEIKFTIPVDFTKRCRDDVEINVTATLLESVTAG